MTVTVDFSRIRGDRPGGQRQAFEELVCQLARREARDRSSLRRIEGAGGDAGVECVHADGEGGLVGYQAKYYTRASEIDWSAVDRSVTAAMRAYAALAKYVVALPCNFTGHRRVKGGAISNGTWGIWDQRVEQWTARASQLGRSIEFVPWTADELHARLTPTTAEGLRRYWFSQIEFTTDWFARHVQLAVADLDERYHPEDHVNVQIQGLFECMARHPVHREKLTARFKQVEGEWVRAQEFVRQVANQAGNVAAGVHTSVTDLLGSAREVSFPIWEAWNVPRWRLLLDEAQRAVTALARWTWDDTADPGQGERKHDDVRNHLHELGNALQALDDVLDHPFMAAEAAGAALLAGRAGSGKSHVLARIAERWAAEGTPVVLLLGQQFQSQPVWPQILQRLDIANASTSEFLGGLDAAAEALGVRGLILVDALNEGPGARFWRNEIGSFLHLIARYGNLAVVVSCRTEYVEYLVPDGVLAHLPNLKVHGFESESEQAEAARVYLDRRGIVRPATPWLAPEFTNPLFLRSCCTALQREGRHEFPRGLSGTKEILDFFMDSTARHLVADRAGSSDLVGPAKATLIDIAKRMARDRQTYVSLEEATEIAAGHLRVFDPPPVGMTWLEVLQRSGLLRFDPRPHAFTQDDRHELREVVRFTFQRFQDHLMADAILLNVDNVAEAFETGGALAFLHDGESVRWQWRGLLGALSVQVPEKFKSELVDAMPGGADTWWNDRQIQDAFAESIRGRSPAAFSERTLGLFNRLSTSSADQLAYLIELSASANHPWNAELIDRNCKKRSQAERDAFWTVSLNRATYDDSHPIHRLIDWCMRRDAASAGRETVRLCAIVLAWCLTASSRPIRDRSTKALTALFLARADLFSDLLSLLAGTDDLYVWERVFAAGFGACCLDRTQERLRAYASATAAAVFNGATPPENLLLRDYAVGIIELANELGALPPDVALKFCWPPYKSPRPRLTVSKDEIETVASIAGDASIFHSCEWGDFGRYTVEPAVRDFIRTGLSREPRLTARQRLQRFEREVVGTAPERIDAFEHLRQVQFSRVRIHWRGDPEESQLSDEDLTQWTQEIEEAENGLLELLTPGEVSRYRREARAGLQVAGGRTGLEPKRFDLDAAKRWVAKEAYGLGWTAARFSEDMDEYYADPADRRPAVERIGKKYQRLALSKLLCRLADNYWVAEEFSDDAPRKYQYSTDIGFFRDTDPTVVVREGWPDERPLDSWAGGPEILIPSVEEGDLAKWPFLREPADALPDLVTRRDASRRAWTTLYDHHGVTTRYDPHVGGDHGLRLQEFRFLCGVLVDRADADGFVERLTSSRRIDIHAWDPPEYTDGPFLGELPWRATWPGERWSRDSWLATGGIRVAFPVWEYAWESHLDAALVSGAAERIPASWLIKDLGLEREQIGNPRWCDATGVTRFIGSARGDSGAVAVIDAELLRQHLDRESLECVWVYLAERNAWPGGHNEHAAWRRTEGVIWRKTGELKVVTWNEDWVKKNDADVPGARRGTRDP